MDGWVYAADFNAMAFNITNGIHFTNAFLQSVKRRKWVRLAVRDTGDDEYSTTMGGEDENDDYSVPSMSTRDNTVLSASSIPPGLSPKKRRQSLFSKGKHKVKSLFRRNTSSKQRESDGGVTETWRSKIFSRCPNAFLSLCKEKSSSKHPVVLDWAQIKSIEVVTDSELYITAEVSRYMGQDQFGQDEFRYAEATIFVTGCPATSLKRAIRRAYYVQFD